MAQYPFAARAAPWAQAPMVAKSALIQTPTLSRYPQAAKMYAFGPHHPETGNLLHPSVSALVSTEDSLAGLAGQGGMMAAAGLLGLGALVLVVGLQAAAGYAVGKALCPPGEDESTWKWVGAALAAFNGLPLVPVNGPLALGAMAAYAYSKET